MAWARLVGSDSRSASRNQRPATSGGAARRAAPVSRGRAPRTRGGAALDPVGAAAAPGQRPQRGEGVVADPARPGEVPQRRGQRLVVGGADGGGQLAEEVGAAAGERLEHGLVQADRSSSPWSGSVSGAVSARCRETQPSAPGSAPWPAHSTSPVAVSSSSIEGW